MPSAANLSPETRFMGLFVGPKHSGKTVAACSFLSKNSQKRIRVLDGDGRIRGILGAPWIQRDRIDYDYYPPKIAGNAKTFFERVNQDLEAMLVEINNGKCIHETYISDSATAFTKNLILDAIPLTHAAGKGKKIGTINMAGPEDYGFESTGMDAYLSFLRSIPLNVIMTAHVIDKWDKPMVTDAHGRSYKDQYAESVIVGEKISLRDKIAANMSIYFDHIFKFNRRMIGQQERFFVEFIGNIACTSFPNMPTGEIDITGKNFYELLMELVNKK